MQGNSLEHLWFHLTRWHSLCSATLTSGLSSQINILIQGCSYSCVVSSVVYRAMEICLWIIAAAAVAMATWINDRIRVREFTFECQPRVREQHGVSWWWIWKGLSELENVWRAWAEGRGEEGRSNHRKEVEETKSRRVFFQTPPDYMLVSTRAGGLTLYWCVQEQPLLHSTVVGLKLSAPLQFHWSPCCLCDAEPRLCTHYCTPVAGHWAVCPLIWLSESSWFYASAIQDSLNVSLTV